MTRVGVGKMHAFRTTNASSVSTWRSVVLSSLWRKGGRKKEERREKEEERRGRKEAVIKIKSMISKDTITSITKHYCENPISIFTQSNIHPFTHTHTPGQSGLRSDVCVLCVLSKLNWPKILHLVANICNAALSEW